MITKRHAATLIEFVARTALEKDLSVSVMKRSPGVPVAWGRMVEVVSSGTGMVKEAEVKDSEAAIGPDFCSLA